MNLHKFPEFAGGTIGRPAIPVTFTCGKTAFIRPLLKDGRVTTLWFWLELKDDWGREIDIRLVHRRYCRQELGHLDHLPTPPGRVQLLQAAIEILPCMSLDDVLRPAPDNWYA